jgi:Pyruvate/2-oxoacid:ferredoxin oxidoreductase gamma subunit
MVMLGAILSQTHIVSMSHTEDAMKALFTGGKSALIPANMKALDAWQASA